MNSAVRIKHPTQIGSLARATAFVACSGARRQGRAPARRRASLAGLMLAALTCAVSLTQAVPAYAVGPDAIMTPAGYDANAVARGDDTSNLVVNLPFSMNWNGTTYDQIYINMNGNCTFGSGYTAYNPTGTLASTNANIMAPFWADVDTRNTATNQVTYSSTVSGNVPQVDGRNAFFVNWIGVGRYNNQSSPTNSFQLVIVDRSDTGVGNFDFMFNYDEVAWDIATAASSRRARAGWGRAGAGYELPGSGTAQTSASALLDSSPSATSLIQNSLNSDGQLGRYVWQVRGGQPPNMPPQLSVIDRVLEGNAPDSYAGYTGAGDVTASDPDGSIASLINDLPDPLPLGNSQVTWTATDNSGFSVSRVQSIDVQDTTPPTTPVPTSPTHVTGAWSTNDSVRVDWSAATDACTGLEGYSYSWSLDAPAIPTGALGPPVNSVIDSQSFPSAAWPAGWTRSSTTYVRLTNAAGRTQGTYAAEIWANSNTRRTANFYRDYDLTDYITATLSFQESVVGFAGGSDYARVEYSTDGGATYTQLHNVTASSDWSESTYPLPVGGTVRVRFSASVNRTAEYVDRDDITVSGASFPRTVTDSLADGAWFFNVSSVDGAGNRSPAGSLGPIMIDRNAPSTSDDAPAGWSNEPVSVTLSASDPGGVVAVTYYRIDGGATQTYSGPILVSAQGTTTIQYWSVDAAGNTETPRTTTVRVDTVPPTPPGPGGASAIGTSTVEVTWTESTDTLSGVAYYRVLRDGSEVATTAALSFEDVDLEAGETYVYRVVAVDNAGNVSGQPDEFTVTMPISEIWLSLSTSTVDLGALDPAAPVAVPDAVRAVVGGIGAIGYDFYCSARDFENATPGSSTPTMPAGMLSYATRGHHTVPARPFTTANDLIHSSAGMGSLWQWTYDFDYSLSVPWDFEPGTYTTVLTYTAVMK